MKTHKGKHGRQIPGPGVGGGGATQHRVNTPSWPTPSPDTLRNVASHEHESHFEAGRPRFSGFVYWLFQSFQEEDCVRNQLLSKTGLWGERGVDRGGSGARLVAQVPAARVGGLCQSGSGTIDRGLGRTRRTNRESETLLFCNRRIRRGVFSESGEGWVQAEGVLD